MHISHPGSHVTQLTAEQRKDVILQHELHLVFVDLPLIEKKKKSSIQILKKLHWLFYIRKNYSFYVTQNHLEKNLSQRADHMKSAVFFPGVRGGFSEDLITEAHGLLQHLLYNKKVNI